MLAKRSWISDGRLTRLSEFGCPGLANFRKFAISSGTAEEMRKKLEEIVSSRKKWKFGGRNGSLVSGPNECISKSCVMYI